MTNLSCSERNSELKCNYFGDLWVSDKRVKATAYGRVSLLGNPSDIYGGKCISFTFNRRARVKIRNSPEFEITGNGGIEYILDYNCKHDLVKASIKKLKLGGKRFRLDYDTDIPAGFGLAGSSAIVIATIRALNEYFDMGLDKCQIAETALHAEADELGIACGFQDRYVISFGGINYMDFNGKEYMREGEAFGKVEKLDVFNIPFFLVLGSPKSSATVHNSLRERFLSGDMSIKERMDKIARLAEEGKNYVLQGNWKKVGELMNKNTELREELCPHLEMDREIIERAKRSGGLGAKLAGSGGSVIVLAEDRGVFEAMSQEYLCLKPKIVR